MKYAITFLAITFLLTACAVNPSNLSKSTSSKKFILPEDIEHIAKISKLATGIESLKKGTYQAAYEDSDGIYFLGPDNCVLIKDSGGKIIVEASGGLWYPKIGSNKKPKIFAYIEKENNKTNQGNGVLINKLIEMDIGKISFGQEINDTQFISKFVIE